MVSGFLARFIVTYAYIFFSNFSNFSYRKIFDDIRMLPYRSYDLIASVIYLCPIIIHAQPLD
nr:hypothetical protein [uncultured bacterium]